MSLFEELLGKHHGRAKHGHYRDDHHGDHHREGHDWGHSSHHDDKHGFGSGDWGGNLHRPNEHGDWGNRGHDGHRSGYGERPHNDSLSHAAPLLALAMRNKAALVAAAVLALILLVVAIGVLVSLLPFLGRTLGFVGENGIKGVIDQFAPLLNLLWNGSGK